MLLRDNVNVVGSLQVKRYNSNNVLVEVQNFKNMVTAVGKDVIAARLIGNTIPVFSHMALGNSNVAVTTSQTTLVAEIGRASLSTSVRTANTITYAATFIAGTATGTLREAGIFNSASGGNMLCRTSFNTTSINKAPGDTIGITWNVTVA